MMRWVSITLSKACATIWQIFVEIGIRSWKFAMAEMVHTHRRMHWRDRPNYQMFWTGFRNGKKCMPKWWPTKRWTPMNAIFFYETWFCIQALILAHVGAIQLYCVEEGESINPRSMNTDVIEWFFGDGR